MKIRVIVNPRAGAGRAARRAEALLRLLAREVPLPELRHTSHPGEATHLAALARDEGVDVLAVVGGDGTFNEVVQAYVDAEGRAVAGPDLAVVPAGTGGDFRRTLGVGTDTVSAARRLLEAPGRAIDLGVLRLTADDGRPVVRAFANIASFGISGLLDRIVNTGPKWMGGKAAFVLGTVRAMAAYRNAPVVVEVDGEPWHDGRVVNVALANGRYFGSGMHVAPSADPADGLLDVVCLGDFSPAESLVWTPSLYRGTHLRSPKVRATRGRRVAARGARAEDTVLVDLDGETPGRLPLEGWILPGALRIRY
jgi:diacylglycerol kinase (ATP)